MASSDALTTREVNGAPGGVVRRQNGMWTHSSPSAILEAYTGQVFFPVKMAQLSALDKLVKGQLVSMEHGG